MGCCRSELKCDSNNIPGTVKQCIEKNSQKSLAKLIESQEFAERKQEILQLLDKEFCKVKILKLNALGYALFLGRSSIFEQLHKAGCSLSATDIILQEQEISILALICSKGYSDILSYFLPFYTNDEHINKQRDRAYSLDFNLDPAKSKRTTTYTPIQMAVQFGHLSIVTLVNDHLKIVQQPPVELDLEYLDEMTGENCALIACRFGNYPMVKFLHQKCSANFMIFNKLGESAIQIAAAGSRISPQLQYSQIIMYLIDIVGVDFQYNYEEVLILIEDPQLIEFLENKLKNAGIDVKKSDLESDGRFTKRNTNHSNEVGPNRFNFMTMYAASCGESDVSVMSSISDRNTYNSFFASTFSFH